MSHYAKRLEKRACEILFSHQDTKTPMNTKKHNFLVFLNVFWGYEFFKSPLEGKYHNAPDRVVAWRSSCDMNAIHPFHKKLCKFLSGE